MSDPLPRSHDRRSDSHSKGSGGSIGGGMGMSEEKNLTIPSPTGANQKKPSKNNESAFEEEKTQEVIPPSKGKPKIDKTGGITTRQKGRDDKPGGLRFEQSTIPGGSQVFLLKINEKEGRGIDESSESVTGAALLNHAFAPIGTEDSYYFPIENADFNTLFSSTSPTPVYSPVPEGRIQIGDKKPQFEKMMSGKKFLPGSTEGYISFRCLEAIIAKSIPDDIFDAFNWAMPRASPKLTRHKEFSEIAKPSDTGNESLASLWNQIKEHCRAKFNTTSHDYNKIILPIRDKNGDLLFAPCALSIEGKAALADMWNKIWTHRRKTVTKGSSGFSPRTESFEVTHPFAVAVSSIAKELFRQVDSKTVFKEIIDVLEAKKSLVDHFVLWDDLSATEQADYVFLSEHPFQLYTTYIHKSDVDLYMRDLSAPAKPPAVDVIGKKSLFQKPEQKMTAGAGAEDKGMQLEPLSTDAVRSDRALPGPDFVSKLEDMFKELIKGTIKAEVEEFDVQELKGDGVDSNVLSVNGEMTIELNPKLQPTTKSLNKISEKIELEKEQKDSTALAKRLAKHKNAKSEQWSETLKAVTLSVEKMNNAEKLSRSLTTSQSVLMGFSAGLMAQTVLGWSLVKTNYGNERQIKNGLYLAEWLHLSAYSWGGTDDTAQGNSQTVSSQVPENLVLGTSESNSCMMRYERAWQTLLRDEAKLCDKDHKISGLLSVTRNPEKSPQCDVKTRVDEYEVTNKKYVWKTYDSIDEAGEANSVKPDVLKKYAGEYKFLAYSILYDIGLEGESQILGKRKDPRAKIVFYPFSRRFHHRAEFCLDEALYRYMYYLAVKDLPNGGRLFTDRYKTRDYLSDKLVPVLDTGHAGKPKPKTEEPDCKIRIDKASKIGPPRDKTRDYTAQKDKRKDEERQARLFGMGGLDETKGNQKPGSPPPKDDGRLDGKRGRPNFGRGGKKPPFH